MKWFPNSLDACDLLYKPAASKDYIIILYYRGPFLRTGTIAQKGSCLLCSPHPFNVICLHSVTFSISIETAIAVMKERSINKGSL